MTGERSAFDDLVADLAAEGAVTVDRLGGIEAIPMAAASSPHFPVVAAAIVKALEVEPGLKESVAPILAAGVEAAPSGLTLAELCSVVIPQAPRLGLSARLKEALRRRATERSSEEEAGMAAVAIRGLCDLAITDDSVRPALLDILTGIDGAAEHGVFATATAHVASTAYDHWRDDTATQCLERLTDSDADADAWIALGLVRIIDAVESLDASTVTAGVRAAIEPLQRAVRAGDERDDARMYLAVVLFLSAWGADAKAAELDRFVDQATDALSHYWFHGVGLSEHSGIYRAPFEAELRWLDVVQLLRAVAAAEERDAWYRPAEVLDALSRALEASRDLRPTRTAQMQPAGNFERFTELRLATPFVNEVATLSWLDTWAHENPGAGAELLRAAVARRLEEVGDAGKGPAEDLSAVISLLGVEAAEAAPQELLVRVNQRLEDRQALERATRSRVVNEAIRDVVHELHPCQDFAAEVRQRFEWLIEKVVLFLESRMNVERGSAGGRFAYLFEPNALEGELAVDLKSWLEGNYPGQVHAEVHEIGGGRTDLIVMCGNFRLVIELKREMDDASRDSLSGYLPQVAAYEATTVALGMLVVLDLTAKPMAAANIRDNVWVSAVDGPNREDRPRFVVTVRVPGNRKSPSQL